MLARLRFPNAMAKSSSFARRSSLMPVKNMASQCFSQSTTVASVLNSALPGALYGMRVVELQGPQPATPICGQMLSDFGADVIRVDRIATPQSDSAAVQLQEDAMFTRGKRSIAIDTTTATIYSITHKIRQRAHI